MAAGKEIAGSRRQAEMNIQVVNLQRYRRVDTEGVRRLVQYFLRRRSARPETPVWREISVVLMDNKDMELLNRRHLGREGPTDVIAFHYVFPSVGGNIHIGEIAVNVELAATLLRCRKHGADAGRELALYIAHGCDHLLGADDATEHARRRMLRRELRWLKQAMRSKLSCRLIFDQKVRAVRGATTAHWMRTGKNDNR